MTSKSCETGRTVVTSGGYHWWAYHWKQGGRWVQELLHWLHSSLVLNAMIPIPTHYAVSLEEGFALWGLWDISCDSGNHKKNSWPIGARRTLTARHVIFDEKRCRSLNLWLAATVVARVSFHVCLITLIILNYSLNWWIAIFRVRFVIQTSERKPFPPFPSLLPFLPFPSPHPPLSSLLTSPPSFSSPPLLTGYGGITRENFCIHICS